MLSTALIAMLALAASQDAPAPLSPANLPPPPKPTFTADGPDMNFHFDANWLEVSIEDCRQRALAAVMAQEGFRYAEITAEGHIAGYTSACRLLVLLDAGFNGTNYYVVAASRTNHHAEEVGRELHARFLTTATPATSGKRAGSPDPQLESKLLAFLWRIESYPKSDLFQHYLQVASLVLRKRGYQSFGFVESHGMMAGKDLKVPVALRLYGKREYRSLERIESASRVSKPRIEFLHESTGQIVAVLIPSGEKNETHKVCLLGIRATEPAMLTAELQLLTTTIAKIVYE